MRMEHYNSSPDRGETSGANDAQLLAGHASQPETFRWRADERVDAQGHAGDPINTRTGGFDYSWVDVALPTSAGPLVFLTEGGYRFPLYHTDTTVQDQHTHDAWNRVYADASGVGMFTNYGMYTDPQPSADCGLRDNHAGCVDVCGDARPVYDTWTALPSLD